MAVADVAGDIDVGQEVHLDLDQTVALAGLAAATLDVEAEPAGAIAAGLGFRQTGEPVADRLEGAGIGRGVGPWRAADRRLVDVDDLVEQFQALDPLIGRRRVRGVVQPPRGGLVERLDGEGRLAAAGDPGDAGEGALRNLGGDVLQVVAGGADHPQHVLFGNRSALLGHLDLAGAGKVLAGQAAGLGHDVGGRALGDHFAAVDAGGRAHVDDVVGREDRLLVVLDHQHRVAEIAQALEADQQAGVVALVQADGWLVQHIEHSGQARADLAGQPDTLALAAAERSRGARQVQIVQADVDQEPQPIDDFLEDPPGDLHLLFAQLGLQALEPFLGVADRQVADLADVLAGDLHRQGLGLQAIAVAGLARCFRLVAAELLADPRRVGLAPAAFQVRKHPFEGLVDLVFAGVVVIDEADLVAAGAVQDHLSGLVGQLPERGVHREVVVPGQGLQGLGVERRGALGPGRDRPLVQGLVLVGDNPVGVERQLHAQAVADRAGAIGIVEREQPGLDLADREAGDRAGEFLGEQQAPGLVLAFGFVGPFGHRDAVGQLQRGLDGIGVAGLLTGLGDQAIDDDVDVVLEFLVEDRRVLDGEELAVDLQPLKAGLLPLGDFLAVLALAAAHNGGQQIEPLAFRQRGQLVDHHRDGLALDRQAGGRRIRDADAGPEQAHVVVDLGHRADRRARVAAGGLLLDGDRRRQALDQVDVGLAHQFQELAGIGRQALDIAPLALGVDGVESQRALARPRQPGQHHQLAARDVHADVLQVVLARAAHADEIQLFGHAVPGTLGAVGGCPAPPPM